MLQLLWDIFKKTGQINTYMFYKALENADLGNKFTNASDISDADKIESCPEGQDKIGNELTS